MEGTRKSQHAGRQIARGACARVALLALLACAVAAGTPTARADSVNSPNITLNVDTNRVTGAGNGAGNVAVTVSTITLAEITLPEYNVGGDSRITLQVRPGYQFDPSSNVTAQSATIGFNGGAINAAASLTPSGAADEVLAFNLTSGISDIDSVQDIIRINGIKLRILSAAGAAGPAQTTVSITTAGAGGAFTDQGIIAASITKGAADRLEFAIQPGDTQAGNSVLPAVKIVDFGGNIITNDPRSIALTILNNPGAATLLGATERETQNGVATWSESDALRITTAGVGYTLRATHDGASFLTSDSDDSLSFDITAGEAGTLVISRQPVVTDAGADIIIDVTALDGFGNPVSTPVDVTLDSAVNPGGWPLLVDSSLTKATVNGVASWSTSDHLRITKAISGYRLAASGVGAPVLTNEFDIVSAEPVVLRFVQQPTDTVAEDATDPAPTVEVVDRFGNRTANTASVQLNLVGAACGGSVSGNAAATTVGLAQFPSLVFDTPCASVVLEATADGLIGTISDEFQVLRGAPIATRLAFTKQPVDTLAGENLLVEVAVLDQFDEPFTAASVAITLSLAKNPTATNLLVTSALTKRTVNGVASWNTADGLRIAAAGAGYQIGASGVGAGITSDAFDIETAAVPPDPGDNPAACGACGAGASLAFAPLVLAGIMLRGRTRRTR